MLKRLSLHHFVLANNATILFEKGLNIISGETGTGKTMLLQALYLLFGQKADVELIRKGEEKALIEALITVHDQNPIFSLLESMGIESEKGEDLLIRREISLDGKNKVFINNQQTALYALKELSEHLIEIVSQHSQIMLKNPSYQREILDRFCGIKEELASYRKAFYLLQSLEKEFETLQAAPEISDEKLSLLKEELTEITSSAFSQDEEKDLIEESFRLSRSSEITEKGSQLIQFLSRDEHWMNLFLRQKKEAEELSRLDPFFEPICETFSSSIEKLIEIHYEIEKHLSLLEFDQEKLGTIDERLQQIKHLKRRYGTDENALELYKEKLQKEILFSENREIATEELLKKIDQQKECVQALGLKLLTKRIDAGNQLSMKVKKHLHNLNMKGSDFKIKIEKTHPSEHGIDEIQFLLEANPHEGLLPIADGASGGELSRLALSMKVELASLESHKILVLDEIDANIGGTTATLVGELLKSLGQKRQVLCITHFPQVALFADHHLKIIKSQKEGRVHTEVSVLKDSEKQEELLRMLGGKTPI